MDKLSKKNLISGESIRKLIYKETINETDIFIQHEISIQSLMDSMLKKRNKNSFTVQPNCDIYNELKILSNDSKFYLFDSGLENNNRIVLLEVRRWLIYWKRTICFLLMSLLISTKAI